MKVTLRVKTKGSGRKFVRCECCKEKRVFPSFKKAGEHAVELGVDSYSAERIDL